MGLATIVNLYMQKTAAPIKKGANLWTVEGGKIVTYVVTGVGPKNTKVQRGKTVNPNERAWGEQLLAPSRTPGDFVSQRQYGGNDVFYSSLEDARLAFFQAGLFPLQRALRELTTLKSLRVETIRALSQDLGIPLDESRLQAQPE